MLKKETWIDLLCIVGLIIFSRLLPHWPNMTALGAAAILGPRWFKNNPFILLAPLLALLISDLLIGLHETMIFTYSAIFLISWISGSASKKSVEGVRGTLGWAFFSSAIFFLITNFGVWLTLEMYPKTPAGLLLSYWSGLPFWGNDFVGTLTYLGVAQWARRWWLTEKPLNSISI